MRLMGIVLAFAFLAIAGSAHADDAKPQKDTVFVRITPTLDDSERSAHAETIKRAVAPAVTDKHVDINVTQLSITTTDNNQIEVVAEIGFEVSTSHDEIASFGNQVAKITLPKSRAGNLAQLRGDAIRCALEDLVRRLRHAA